MLHLRYLLLYHPHFHFLLMILDYYCLSFGFPSYGFDLFDCFRNYCCFRSQAPQEEEVVLVRLVPLEQRELLVVLVRLVLLEQREPLEQREQMELPVQEMASLPLVQ
jgi:hypothetical protein